jgi:hypothetical protein
VFFSPYRCVACGKRFFKLSHRLESLLGWGAVLALVVGLIVTVIYMMNVNVIDPVKYRRPVPTASAPVPGNTTEAAKATAPYARAAAGDIESQYTLGMLYLNGEGGVAKNYAEALKWLELAAKGGHAEARYNLGIMYRTGQGALQNFELAFQWFELAAGQNHTEAQYNVALMYKIGMSVPVDLVKSYTWVNIAAVHGHVGAMTLRDNLLQAMTPQQVAEGQRASREWKPVEATPKEAPAPVPAPTPAPAPSKG